MTCRGPGRRRRSRRCRGCARGRAGGRGRVERHDRAGVDPHRSGDRSTGVDAVVERLLDRGRRLGVAEQHRVLPGLATLDRPELALQLREELRVRRLRSPTGTEDRSDEGGDRDHVVDRHRRLVDVVRLEVGGDAVGLRLHVGDHLPTLGAVGLDDEVRLVGEELLGLRARHERLTTRDEPERVDARDVRDRRARRTPPELEEEAAVTRRHPACAEGQVRTRLAGDVRNAVRVVDDRGPRVSGRLDVGGPDGLEVLRDEVRVDVCVGDVARATA